MATTTTITKFLFRRGNDSDREQTILASGEPGFTLDTKRLWVGDGITPGGIPALSARNDHLHFIDKHPGDGDARWTIENRDNSGGAQYLDINIVGLSQTLAGEVVSDTNTRWFHPVTRDIETEKNLLFASAESQNAEIEHAGSGELKIHSSNPTTGPGTGVNLNDRIFVRNDKVYIQGPVDIASSDIVFTGVEATHFSDKTIDINVLYGDAQVKDDPLDPGQGVDSNGAGFYIAHDNYLSAGWIRVGEIANQVGMSCFELCPPLYYNDWESNSQTYTWGNSADWNTSYKVNPTDRTPGNGRSTFTQDFEPNTGTHLNPDHNSSKPIIIQSLRPSDSQFDFNGKQYTGHAHLSLEAGLMVYDAGDSTTGAYNSYKINQSLDTRAVPTFAGINIRKEDGTPGAPLGVSSGGTGQNLFNSGGVIYTSGDHDSAASDNDLLSMSLTQGSLMIGTENKGVVASKLAHSEWITFDYSDGTGSRDGQSDGVIRVNNTFAPDYLSSDTTTREKWFTKFSTWVTDTGSIKATGKTPTDPSEKVTIRGDYTAQLGGTIRTVHFDTGIDNRGVRIEHNDLASYAYSKGSQVDGLTFIRAGGNKAILAKTLFAGITENNRYFDELIPVTPEDDDSNTPAPYRQAGFALGGVTINNEGHVIGIRSKDFDDRYPQLFGMGTGGRFGDDLSPADLSKQVHIPDHHSNAESYLPAGQKSNSYNKVTRVITGTSFGDYGTVSDYTHQNLNDIFYDKAQMGSVIDTLDTRLDAIDVSLDGLGGSAFLRNTNTFTDRKITTGWYSGSEIQFSAETYASGAAHNKVYTTTSDWHFKPHMGSNTSFYIPTDKNIEWRRLTSQDGDNSDTNDASQVMMSLAQDGDTTKFDIYEDGNSRVSVNMGRLEVKNTSGSVMCKMSETGLTVNGTASFAQNLGVTGDIYVGSNGGHDSNIFFYDDNSNTHRTFQWDDSAEAWMVEDNTGTMRHILHSGNLNVSEMKAGDSNRLNGQLGSYYATANHNHTYDVNNEWLREKDDNNHFKCYGGARQMVFRTDGTSPYKADIGGYAFTWQYGGDAAANRTMLLSKEGTLWTKSDGWLHEKYYTKTGGTISGDMHVTGTISCAGDIVAFSSSDRTLKDNLKPITDPLAKINKISGYEFDWNDKQEVHTGHDVGVVAQEIEQVLPDVVRTREDGTKAVNYEKIVPLLIESIKELSTQVENLKSKLK